MTGDEHNMATLVDSTGRLWTITPGATSPGTLDLTAHTDEGPVTLTVPVADGAALANRIKAVATAEILSRVDVEIDAAEAEPAPMAARDQILFDNFPALVFGDDADRERVREELAALDAPARPACDGTCGDQCDGGPDGIEDTDAVDLADVVDLFANGPGGQVVS